MKLFLSKLPWFNKDDIWVTGFIFTGETFLREKDLVDYFSGITTVTDFETRLRSANGQFSVVFERGNIIWTATDITRNWPLFYTKIDGKFILSDDCYRLADLRSKNEFDQASVNCFLASGYTINDHTLMKNIYQVEAGAIVTLGSEAKSLFYHTPALDNTTGKDLKTGSDELSLMIENVFRGYFTALKDRFIAIPLSGGYDSRLVALMASRYHPENVLCYTYGRKDNPEVALAMESANRLRLKWINIVYDSDLVGDFIHDSYFEKYYPWVSNLTGMFFLQEYFAVRYLKQNKLIPDNTVFMSGYSGDFIAGSYLTPSMKKQMDKKKISKLIVREYFRLVNLDRNNKYEVMKLIEERIKDGVQDAWKYVESWDLKERHAKFIVNSAKVFSYFGYEYIFPLWDNKLVDYMLPLPFNLRMDRKLYEYTLRDIIFRVNDLNLANETNPSPIKKSFQRFKDGVKPVLPEKIRNQFLSPLNHIFYDEITAILKEEIDTAVLIPPAQPNFYNSYIIQWYLAKTAEKFNLKPIQ
jgi:asparagine synthase (glutamine-hydrolysing)